MRRSANPEAIAHLTAALELLKTLPDTPDRTQQELSLQISLGAPLMASKGFAAPEVERAYTRARELCEQLGETPQLFPVLYALSLLHYVRAEYKTARELGEQYLAVAQSIQDSASLVSAHYMLLCILFDLGELVPAREHAEQGLVFYDPQQHHSLAFLTGYDPGMGCLSVTAWTLWLLGYPDQAIKRSYEALALAQQLSHPHSLASTLSFAALLHQYRREGKAIQEQTQIVIALSTEHGFPLWLALGTLLQGWALADQGQIEEGILVD